MAVPRSRAEAWRVPCRGGEPRRSRCVSHLEEDVSGGSSALSAPHPTQAGRQALQGRLTCPGVWSSPFSSPSTPGLLLLFLTQAWTKSPTHKNTIRTTYLKGKAKVTSHQIDSCLGAECLTRRSHSLARDAKTKGGVLWRRKTFLVFVILLQPTHPHLNSSPMEAE